MGEEQAPEYVDAAWLDGQIENERYLIERGRGSQAVLRFLIRERDRALPTTPIDPRHDDEGA